MRWLLFLLIMPLAFGLEWSEILFDATGDDNGKEFIEFVGSENLSGCVITDTRSSDTLVLLQQGTNVQLIVEEDHSFTTDATLYSAGKAIGNGLGNTYEELTLTCDAFTLETTYNTSLLEGFAPGMSIQYDNGWTPANATPGMIDSVVSPHAFPRGQVPRYCNTTLVITVSNGTNYPGDPVLFTIVSAAYASFTVEANSSVILEGDTISRNAYSFVMPAHDVVITAFARACDAKQRAKRHILLKERPPVNVSHVVRQHVNHTPAVRPTNISVTNTPQTPPVPITAAVVYDEDENVVPWLSVFGIVTLLVSAGLYKYERWERD